MLLAKFTLARGPAQPSEVKALATRLAKESPLKNKEAKRALAESAASLIVHQRQLMSRNLTERGLPAEEARTIPAVASGLRRALEALGVLAPAEEDAVDFR